MNAWLHVFQSVVIVCTLSALQHALSPSIYTQYSCFIWIRNGLGLPCQQLFVYVNTAYPSKSSQWFCRQLRWTLINILKLWTGWSGTRFPAWRDIFLFSETLRPAVGLTHPPILSFPKGKAAGPNIQLITCRQSAELKNAWSHTSASPVCLLGVH